MPINDPVAYPEEPPHWEEIAESYEDTTMTKTKKQKTADKLDYQLYNLAIALDRAGYGDSAKMVLRARPPVRADMHKLDQQITADM